MSVHHTLQVPLDTSIDMMRGAVNHMLSLLGTLLVVSAPLQVVNSVHSKCTHTV
jgi:hypothetical protein